MSKRRLITSYSDVITNSSTQVFFLDIEEKLIKLLNDKGRTGEVVIINNKEDVIRAIELYQREIDNGEFGNNNIFSLLNYSLEWYDMYTEYGKGDYWLKLNENGRTDREIVEFIWPLVSDIAGKLYYSFQDDCGTSEIAEILWENGYYSERE